ncbi:MAG: response regulator [Bacteroidota bacterium]|nr:response regulator [Bacteroidota bacterium]
MEKRKILYVDDEKINLLLFEANLEKKYTVLTAEDGISALEILSENKDIEIVISDMRMPNMNGIEFIQCATELYPTISYYILTGYDITDEIQKALNKGLIRRYFSKPFRINEIISEIDTVLTAER